VLQTFRRYPELFNRKLFGINYYVGGAFFVSVLLSNFIWPLVYALFNGFHSYFYPFQFYLIQIAFDVLGAAIFLFVSHLALKDWILPLLFGLANVLIHIPRLLIFNAIPMEGIRFIAPFHLGGLIGSFLWSFLFFLGLVLAVRLFGPKIWSLMLGSASAYLLSALINPLLFMSSGAKYSLNVESLVAALTEGVLFAVMIYVGLYLNLSRRGYRLDEEAPASVIPGSPLLSKGSGFNYKFNSVGSVVGLMVGGIVFLILGWIITALAAGDSQETGIVAGVLLLMIGTGLLIAGAICMIVLFYQIWKFVIYESRYSGLPTSIDSPGKAVGFLFIPIFSFYWIFVAYGKLPDDINALARARGLHETLAKEMGIAIPILNLISIIPLIGFLTGLISFVLQIVFFSRGLRMCRTMRDAALSRASTIVS
jgi:hypothetical protein